MNGRDYEMSLELEIWQWNAIDDWIEKSKEMKEKELEILKDIQSKITDIWTEMQKR